MYPTKGNCEHYSKHRISISSIKLNASSTTIIASVVRTYERNAWW